MNTRSYHQSNLGSYASGGLETDSCGYVTYHDSPRYGKATTDQLERWRGSRFQSVRNAALTELSERSLQVWRNTR